MNRPKTFKVASIEKGVVIDHIPTGKAFKCLKIIEPDATTTITMGVNVNSSNMGKKDFIKIEGIALDNDKIGKIALIAPNCTINVIRDYQVIEKKKVEMPAKITGTISCINPRCATRQENYLTPSFTVETVNPLRLKCEYCDRSLLEEDVLTQLK